MNLERPGFVGKVVAGTGGLSETEGRKSEMILNLNG